MGRTGRHDFQQSQFELTSLNLHFALQRKAFRYYNPVIIVHFTSSMLPYVSRWIYIVYKLECHHTTKTTHYKNRWKITCTLRSLNTFQVTWKSPGCAVQEEHSEIPPEVWPSLLSYLLILLYKPHLKVFMLLFWLLTPRQLRRCEFAVLKEATIIMVEWAIKMTPSFKWFHVGNDLHLPFPSLVRWQIV